MDNHWIYVKGAPEKIISMCSSILTSHGPVLLEQTHQERINEAIREMTQKALRLIAVAYTPADPRIKSLKNEALQGNLIFTGIFGMIDPPRKEAIESIAICKKAGIRVIMITGDNPLTAAAIAKKMAIPFAAVITGQEIQTFDDEELKRKSPKSLGLRSRRADPKIENCKSSSIVGPCGRDDRRWSERCSGSRSGQYWNRNGYFRNRRCERIGRYDPFR